MGQHPEITPLSFRLRQERLITVFAAQEVADGTRIIQAEEATRLHRYAQCHFGRSFDQMIRECQQMTADVESQAAEA